MNSVSLSSLKKYTSAFLLAFLVTVVLFSLLSLVFALFSPPMWIIDITYKYGFLFSAFLAAFFSGIKKVGRGFLTGLISANIYVVILMILGVLIFKSSVAPALFLKKLVPVSFVGAIGGILGINCK